MNDKVWKIGCLYILVSSLTITGEVKSACTPTPDCVAMGYTETSCEGRFIRCPFDTTKLYCTPCDSSFKYDCSGDNITGGTGSACGGKYTSCECAEGGIFKDGTCPQNCTVGMIYYSDKSCSEDVDASKTAIGVVVKDNELIASLNVPEMTWSSAEINVSELTDYSSLDEAQMDYNGKNNTLAIVAAFPSDTIRNNAAIYCNSYSTAGTNAGDWYLPARGELVDYIQNRTSVKNAWSKVGVTIERNILWASSEASEYYAWYLAVGIGGSVDGAYKLSEYLAVCFCDI